MAVYTGQDVKVYEDEFDISGYSTKVAVNEGTDLTDVTCFGDTGHKWYPAVHDTTVNIETWLDDSATASLAAFKKKRTGTTAGVLTVLPKGDAYGYPALFGQYWQESGTTDMAVGAVHKLNWSVKYSGHPSKADMLLQSGIVLYPKTAVTGDLNGTTQDNGASSTGGANAVLHVFSVSASDQVVVTIHVSSDNFAADDDTLITFTTATAATSEFKSVTGTVKRYVRAVFDVTGSDVSIPCAVEFNRL
jgi:hypothetical protein